MLKREVKTGNKKVPNNTQVFLILKKGCEYVVSCVISDFIHPQRGVSVG